MFLYNISRIIGPYPMMVKSAGDPKKKGVGFTKAVTSGKRMIIEKLFAVDPMHSYTYTLVEGAPVKEEYQGKVEFTPSRNATRLTQSATFTAKIPGMGWIGALVIRNTVNRIVDVIEAECRSTAIPSRELIRWRINQAFPIELSEKIKQEIHDLDDTHYCISCPEVLDLELYGKKYSVPIRRTHKQVRFHEIEKMKMKAAVMDIGDMLKVICMPGEKRGVGSYVDVLEQSSTSDRSQIMLRTVFE